MTNNLSFNEIETYENLLVNFYRNYLSYNYLAELLNTTLKHLPEGAPVDVLSDLTENYTSVSGVAKATSDAWVEAYFDMVEGSRTTLEQLDLSNIVCSFADLHKEASDNMGNMWLYISEILTQEQHDAVLLELDASISAQDIAEQYDQVLSGMNPSMPENIRSVIAELKSNAQQQEFVA